MTPPKKTQLHLAECYVKDEKILDQLTAMVARIFPNNRSWTRQQIGLLMKNPYVHVYFLLAGQQALGLLVSYEDYEEIEIYLIGILAEHRRQGYGQSLLQQFLRTVEKGRIFLEVRSQNTPAISLYKKNGFNVIFRRPHYYSQPDDDALMMVKKIKEEEHDDTPISN